MTGLLYRLLPAAGCLLTLLLVTTCGGGGGGGVDNAPEIFITGLLAGDIVDETRTVQFRITDDRGLTQVAIAGITQPGAPNFIPVDAVLVEDDILLDLDELVAAGPQTFTVIARDDAGQESSAVIGYTIDRFPRLAVISGLTEGEVVTTSRAVSFSVTDDLGLTQVRISVDNLNEQVIDLPAAPLDPGAVIFILDPAGLAAGLHVLIIAALDTRGANAELDVNFTTL